MDNVRARRIAAELQGTPVGGWTVGEYLGNGASAVVLTARRGDQTAALKLIDPEMVERFGAEHQLARVQRECELVGHTEPHLVKIYDGGRCQASGYLYLVMELLAHPALTALIPGFPRERIGPVIRQIASAARFLESQSLTHRDIKPDNVAISRDCEHAVLLDLGVVRPLTDRDLPDAGTGDAFLGTTRYSPPEYVMRAEDEENPLAWRAITFYQLGAVLHDMIMRRRLFDEISAPPARLIEAVRFSRPIVDAPDVPTRLATLARNCLQKDWRLRLELVHWEDFEETTRPIQGTAAKERIRRRLAVGTGTETLHRQTPPISRHRVLRDLGGSIANTVREICLQAGTFPPLEVRLTAAEQEYRISVRTGPSGLHLLEAPLDILLSVAVLDDEGLILRVRGVAGVGILPEDPPSDTWSTIYTGETSSPALRERLDSFLHLALDMAQNVGAEPAESFLRLAWEE